MTVFGHQEVIQKIPRQTTVKATCETEIFYIEKNRFLEIFGKEEIRQFAPTLKKMDI